MKQNTFAYAFAVVGLGLLIGLAAPQAQAQTAQEGRGGGFSGTTTRIGTTGSDRSVILLLIERDDVRRELSASASQREHLDHFGKRAGQDLMTIFRANPIASDPNVSQEENLARQQEAMDRAEIMMQSLADDTDKRVGTILTPRQMTRLHELDLQWRGPLAAVDKRVAEELNLTRDQKGQIFLINKAYNLASFTVRSNALSKLAGLTGVNGARPLSADEIQKRIVDASQPEVDRARKAGEEKVLALLNPDQQAKWKEMTGKKFTFHDTEN